MESEVACLVINWIQLLKFCLHVLLHQIEFAFHINYKFEVCLLVWFASQLHDFKHRKLNIDSKEIINHRRVPLFITLGKLTVSVGILNFWERGCTTVESKKEKEKNYKPMQHLHKLFYVDIPIKLTTIVN